MKWIKCSERLPKEEQKTIVWVVSGTYIRKPHLNTSCYSPDRNKDGFDIPDVEITHWMPYPEPPNEEK